MSVVYNKKMAVGDWANYALLGLIAISSLFPFLYIVSISLTDPEAYVPLKFYLLPDKWSFASYAYILSTPSFLNALKSTTFITVVGTVLNILITFTMAYGLTKKWVPGRSFFLGAVIITLFFNAGVIPNYILVKEMGLLNSYWSLIWPSLTNAFSLIVVKSFMESIHPELEDSARIDGCNEIGVFVKIIIPLSMPAIAAFTLFFAVQHWNTYFNALIYISDTKKWTLQVLIKQLVIEADASGIGQAGSSDEATVPQETIRMASIVLAMLPILFVYPFLQKHFAKGVTLGSVKG
ncbi:carbohydrate ABC transporter permease [Paenibacillus agricola]|uniref:Carbohydrate ABC transporter permease n=1 Tax=Paenibacillus agricola TaxID=2716264 RepID=A0ABX0IZ81_9BACL|nr:carbohydrate ABC transporter permease [Paenibacillus agricola]NHN29018.1 carbohydrate ABC transporter permease [Paenibacillus agricola]